MKTNKKTRILAFYNKPLSKEDIKELFGKNLTGMIVFRSTRRQNKKIIVKHK